MRTISKILAEFATPCMFWLLSLQFHFMLYSSSPYRIQPHWSLSSATISNPPLAVPSSWNAHLSSPWMAACLSLRTRLKCHLPSQDFPSNLSQVETLFVSSYLSILFVSFLTHTIICHLPIYLTSMGKESKCLVLYRIMAFGKFSVNIGSVS